MNRDIEVLVNEFVGKLDKVFSKIAAAKVRELVDGLSVGAVSSKFPQHAMLVAGKRSPEDLSKLQAQLLSYVTKNPGQRCEEIAKGMGVQTSDLALPLRKLGKQLKHQGVARGRRYFAK